jgi:DNA topoisomerase-1
VLTIGMNRAMEVLAQKAARGGRGTAAKALRELGAHPDGGTIGVYDGKYGPYVKWEKVNATLPKEMDAQAVTLEQALELIAAKKPAKKTAARRKPAGKTSAAKTAASPRAARKKA